MQQHSQPIFCQFIEKLNMVLFRNALSMIPRKITATVCVILFSSVTNGLVHAADCAEALVTVFGHEGGYQNSKHDGDIPDPVAMNINATTVP